MQNIRFSGKSVDLIEKELLDFEAETTLDEMLDIVIPWIKEAHQKGFY